MKGPVDDEDLARLRSSMKARCSGEARRKAVARARTAIGRFRPHLQSYPLLQALDEHSPAAFGVQLSSCAKGPKPRRPDLATPL